MCLQGVGSLQAALLPWEAERAVSQSSGALPLTWLKIPTFTGHLGKEGSLNTHVYFCSLHHCTQLTMGLF